MPSRPDPVHDEQFEELVSQVRAARPRASADLRRRVNELTRVEPVPRRSLGERLLGFRPRMAAAFAAVLVIAAAVGSIAVLGQLGTGGGGDQEGAAGEAVSGEAAVTSPEADAPVFERAQPESVAPLQNESAPGGGADSAAAPPPSTTRLQNYEAELTVRVDDLDELSDATARAMATARRLGGFVVAANFDAPSGPDGQSFLVVRVPVTKVQAAIAAYSELGTLVGQRVALQDVQPAFNRLSERIAGVRARIARLQADLARPGVTDEERVVLRARLEAARDELNVLLEQREGTLRQARLARISLTLTTVGPNERPQPPGDAERTLRDALDALETVSVWMLAVLIVAAPFLALLAVGIYAGRRLRRRSAERLLERPGS